MWDIPKRKKYNVIITNVKNISWRLKVDGMVFKGKKKEKAMKFSETIAWNLMWFNQFFNVWKGKYKGKCCLANVNQHYSHFVSFE